MSNKVVAAAAEKAIGNLGNAGSKAVDWFQTPGGIATQLLIGCLITFIVYWISLKVLNADTLLNASLDTNKKSVVNIITGYAESSQLARQSFNTVNTYASAYLPLTPSVNIKGGAQFTYSLWLFVGNSAAAAASHKPIFIRGDRNKYRYTMAPTRQDPARPTPGISANDYVAMCPLLEFGTNPMDFNIRFNTSNNVNEVMPIISQNSGNSIYRQNLLNMLQGQWFMMTIVFEDNMPINDFENGLSVKVYINGTLYKTATYAAMLKQNNGNFFLFPEGSVDQCKISSLNYYNYAQGDAEIKATMGAGPSSKPQASLTSSFVRPLALSDYNTMDIYNI